MLLILSQISTLASIFKLIFLLLIFIGLLFAASYFTKWYAKSTMAGGRSSNISIIESKQIAPGKSIVLARIGNKYISFVLTKEHASFLTEIDREELHIEEKVTPQNVSFREVLQKIRKKDDSDDTREKK